MFKLVLAMVSISTLLAGEASAMDATVYGSTDGYAGAVTASGDTCCDHNAASPNLPFGTPLTICYASCTTVIVNDRCLCSLDVGYPAAAEIGMLECGRCDISVY